MTEQPDLTPLYEAALPKDAEGAWIRQAIEDAATEPTDRSE